MVAVKDLRKIDLETLLLLLPNRTDKIEDTVLLGRNENNKGWAAVYQEKVYSADTPKGAILKLLVGIGVASV